MSYCIIPNGQLGPWTIDRYATPGECVSAEAHLFHSFHGLIMAEWPRLLYDMEPAIAAATGRVLIGGLGLGIVLTRMLAKSEVTEVVVLEKDADIITLAGAHFIDPRVNIIYADAFMINPNSLGNFDCGWFDLWHERVPPDQAAVIHTKWSPRCSWFGIWEQRA